MKEGLEKYFQLMYTDRMDITTTQEVAQGDATNNVYPATPQQTDVHCRISFPRKDTRDIANKEREKVELKPVIFCDPNVSVKPGDKIAIRRCKKDGTVYATLSGLAVKAAKPNVWVNHREFELDVSGDA